MAVTLRREYAADNGSTYIEYPPARTQSVVVSNNSECYILIRLGGTDPPNTATRADRIVGPYSQAGINGHGPFAFTFTTNPSNDDLFTVSHALAGVGSCQVEYTSRSIVEYVSSLPGSIVSTGSDTPGYDFPWGHIGQNQAGNWSGSFNARGWQGLRVTMGNQSEHAAHVLIKIRHFGAGGYKDAPHHYTLWRKAGRSIGIPLPILDPANTTDDLEVEIIVWSWAVAPEYVHITPMLTGTAYAFDTGSGGGGATGGPAAGRVYTIDAWAPAVFAAGARQVIIDGTAAGEGWIVEAYCGLKYVAADPVEYGLWDYNTVTGLYTRAFVAGGLWSSAGPGVSGYALGGQSWGPVPLELGHFLDKNNQLVYLCNGADSRAACFARYVLGTE